MIPPSCSIPKDYFKYTAALLFPLIEVCTKSLSGKKKKDCQFVLQPFDVSCNYNYEILRNI